MPASEVTTFRLHKLEQKIFKLERVDIKVSGTILYTKYPAGFNATYLKIIDYENLNRGFYFPVVCNYEGAYVAGTTLFQYVTFVDEDSKIPNIYKGGSFIFTTAPTNTTIQHSNFDIEHSWMEAFDVIRFQDSAD